MTVAKPTSFSDTAGRVWTPEVNVAAVKRVRARLGVDLIDLDDGKLIGRLSTDPIFLADVLYVVCELQATAAGVSDEAFGEALAGEPIEHAATALLESLVSFSPSTRIQAALRQVLTVQRQTHARALDVMEQRLPSAIAQAQAEAERALEDLARGSSSTDSPGPSESIQTR
ncbi:MAG TPA: hypothetical protein PKC43_06280 [Phycisphaerales bacterium]|nr:hypothetical protein [Phycisphaerales bacterium]HMP37039.1 hypothetical protein [Phycisphaerales bacterium]